ncbi:MAG: type II toxin-antitoxin system PemK/MazF family toxin [Ilumatobacteraceae bacterium]
MASKLGQAFGKLLGGIRKVTLANRPPAEQPGQKPGQKPDKVPSKGVPGVPPPVDTHRGNHGSTAPSSDSTLAGATIEYNPDLDGDADPGEVVWTWVPWEEDQTQGKDRPVVIVGRRKGMLIGVPLTSQRRNDELQVLVGTGPWDREGRPSYAKLDRILEVDPTQVRREGSILGRTHFDEIVRVLRDA